MDTNIEDANTEDANQEIPKLKPESQVSHAKPDGLLKWLYNNNPFYVISAVLMLYAVRSGYGDIQIGSINCWVMMSVLTGYTIGLSVIGILIVRWGKVWEDARSILLLLLLLFLGVSVSADDLFVKMESSTGGALLMLGGFLGSVLLTELTLRGIGLRMGLLYRIPLHLFFALFYITPWWLSPELHPRTATELNWTLFAFPLIGGAFLLCLLPAVRRGPQYLANNGSPWKWPLYPWTAFGMITLALALRTFAVCMTFGQSGPIWLQLSSGKRAIAFDTMWGIYFLIPIAFAVLMLMLEASLVTRNKLLTRRVLFSLPVIVCMGFPYSNGIVFRSFYSQVTAAFGSPVWIALILVLGVYSVSWLRKIPGASLGTIGCISALSVIGPKTTSLSSLTEPQLLPLLLVGAILLAMGVIRKQSWVTFTGTVSCLYAGIICLEATPLADWKMTITYISLWTGMLAIGFIYKDGFAVLLRLVGAVMLPLAGLGLFLAPQASEIPWGYRMLAIFGFAVMSFLIANVSRSKLYLYVSFALLTLCGYEAAAIGFRSAQNTLGANTMTALLWSGGTLLIGVLISSHKASWLPKRLIPNWPEGEKVES